MRAVIQRVKSSSVEIAGKTYGRIDKGLLVLLGVEVGDTDSDLEWMERKLLNLRVFSDREGKMNLSLLDVNGEMLLISQFTLMGDAKKGNRPSFIRAAQPTEGERLYNTLAAKLSNVIKCETGLFGGDMLVSLQNDGPVTIILDSRNKI